jgi:hypothetical protein
MPIKKSKKILFLSSVMATFSVLVFLTMFFIIKSLNQSSLEKSNEIKNEIEKDESLFFIKKDIENNKILLEKIDNYVIKSDEVVNFIQAIEGLALNNGLKSEVKSVSFTSFSDIDSSYLELTKVKINVVGEWGNVEYFLQILENYPLKINIANISLSKFTSNTVKGKTISQWSGDFEFTVVKLKDK